MKASHKEHIDTIGRQRVPIRAGQFPFGRKKAAEETGLSQQVIRTCLKKLKKYENLTIKTTNKYSIITICNWDVYQGEEISKQPADQPTNIPL